ncbi:MAG: TlpA disulfide reductase family protein [Pyrinomonadaceae bacterium]
MQLLSKWLVRAVVVVGLMGHTAGLLPPTSTMGQVRKRPTTPRRKDPKPAIPPSAIDGPQLVALLKRDGTRPLLVNYWATWCDPCRDEFPDLVRIDNEYRPKGLEFIAVTLDDLNDINTEVPKFLRKMRATMPVYLLSMADPAPAIDAVDRDWGGALPATFLYDSKGEIVYKTFGRVNVDELRAAIEKVVTSGQMKKAERR